MDYSFEATWCRTALLLGLIHARSVQGWAEQVIARDLAPPPAFFEIVSVPATDLTALRHALWPLAVEPEPPAVLEALLGLLGAELASGRRGLADTVIVLRQMRSMLRLPPDLYAGLNAALVAHAAGGASPITGWLEPFAQADAARLQAMPADSPSARG